MTTLRWSLAEDVENYRALGIEGIGVWRRKLLDFGEERGIDLIRESGLAVASLCCAGGFTGSDGHSYREAVRDALEALRLASELQAQCLIVVSGGRAGHTQSHARRLLRDALLTLGDTAGELGVHLAVQSAHRLSASPWTFLTSMEATLDVLRRCNHPHIGMALDTFHVWQEPDFIQSIPELAPWVKTVSLCDSRLPRFCESARCLPGEGLINFGDIVTAFHDVGYRGFFDIQVFCEEVWNADYPHVLAACRQAFEKLAITSPTE